MSTIHPIIIVGAGVVGGVLALLLAKAGIQAIVLDAMPKLERAAIENKKDARVFALNAASLHLLEWVDVAPHIIRQQPYYGMHVWHRDGMGELTFGTADNHQMNHLALGSMIEPSILNLAIQHQLFQQIEDYRPSIKVAAIERTLQGWKVRLNNDEILHTSLLVGADGANSLVRQAAGINYKQLVYKQTALSCAIETEDSSNHIARQIFLDTGPLALLPMASPKGQHWQSIVWTLPEDIAAQHANLADDEFAQLIGLHSQFACGKVLQVQSRGQFPLVARQAEHDIADHLALVGDAAHVIHPMAGLGVNLGILDAAVLAENLIRSNERQIWAHDQVLRRYQHQRRGENSAMMHALSALGWIQSGKAAPIAMLRNTGMQWIQAQTNVKDLIIQKASGMPALAETRYAI